MHVLFPGGQTFVVCTLRLAVQDVCAIFTFFHCPQNQYFLKIKNIKFQRSMLCVDCQRKHL